jgi:hypothetical protein
MKDYWILLIFTVLIMIVTKLLCVKNIEKFTETEEEPIVIENPIIVSEESNVISETSTIENTIEERRETISEEISENNSNNIITSEVSQETITLPDLVVSGSENIIIGQSNDITTNIGFSQSINTIPSIIKGEVILTDGTNTIQLNEGFNYLKDLNANWIKDAKNLVLSYGNNADVNLIIDPYVIHLSEPNTTTMILTQDTLKLFNTIYKSPKALENTSINVSPKLNAGTVLIEAVDNNGNLNSITYKAPLDSIEIPSWIANSNKISYKMGPNTNVLFVDETNNIFTTTTNGLALSHVIIDSKDNSFMQNKYNKAKKISVKTTYEAPIVYDKQNNEKNIRERTAYIINFVGISKPAEESNKINTSEVTEEDTKSSVSIWIYIIGGILGVGFIGAMIYLLMKK